MSTRMTVRVQDTDVLLWFGSSLEAKRAAFRAAWEQSERLREQAFRADMEAAKLGEGGAFEPTTLRLIVQVAENDKSIKQRRFYHGVVLTQIAEQAKVGGVRYTMEVWKEFYRKKFLPDHWVSMRLPGEKRKRPVRERSSTEELGIKGYSDLIDKVIADATTELGVQFEFDLDERESVRLGKRAS